MVANAAATASAEDIQSVYAEFVSLGQSWPKDPLRPDINFGASIISAAQTALLSTQSQASLHPEQVHATQPGDPLPTPLPGTKSLTVDEVEYAKRSLELLKELKDDKVKERYVLGEEMMRPKSMPEYYERLKRSIDRAVGGQSVSMGWGEWFRRFLGRE